MQENQTLHIIMLPWLALGHILPYFFLSISLAQKSHRISFITTLKNSSKLPQIPPNLTHLITLIHFPLPQTLNLPPDSDSTSDLPSHNLRPFLSKSFDSFQQKLINLIKSNQIPSPDFIFFDYAAHWVPSICANLRIPCALFSIFKPAFLCFIGPPSAQIQNANQLTKSPNWIPFNSSIVHNSFEAKSLFEGAFGQNESGLSEIDRLQKSVKGCGFVLIRSCNEFEREWLQLLNQIYEKPVIPVGVLPRVRRDCPSDERGRHPALEWLDRREEGSTVYVAFGSEVKLSLGEVREIELGLELSELPFVWALRGSSNPIETERGLVCVDWVPQMEILDHDSIGGFLTHAGWSSIIEGLGVGRPMVMMPMMSDQPLNARHLVEKGIGVEVLRDENGLFVGDAIAKALRMAMVENEGEGLRAKARECAEVFGNEELNELYVRELVQQLKGFVGVGSSG